MVRGVAAGFPDSVDGGAAGDLEEPGVGAMGQTGAAPVDQRALGGVRERLLGQVEIAERADERGEKPPPVVTHDPLDLAGQIGGGVGHSSPGICMIGRSSIVPCFAVGISAAISMASSRSLQSSR